MVLTKKTQGLKMSQAIASHSINQGSLKNICDKLCEPEVIENLFDTLGIEYKFNNNFYSMCCPIHGGDNSSALNIYHIGDTYRGNWVCRTHSCEKIFLNSILGFIRGVLSQKKLNWTQKGDKMIPFSEVIDFVEKFLSIELKDDGELYDTEKQKFLTTVSIFTENTPLQDNTNALDRETVKSMLSIPSEYFLSRGFSREVLVKYDVGDCIKTNKPMSHRAVVPIYDNDFNVMLGCTGRSIYNKCELCSSYHSSVTPCPNPSNSFFYSKWKHSKGFKTDSSLYNYWYAQKYIKKSHCAVLVESPGNVWKLEMSGVHNALGIYGSSLSAKQKMLLDISGAMTLLVLTDNDEAGHKCRENIEKQCSKIYNVKHLYATKNDVAEMSVEEINELFKEYT